MIYNFRIDRSGREEILRRLKEEKLLSQGWGGGEDGGLPVDQDDYVSKCASFYKLASTRIPTNLLRMRGLKDKDVLATPHLPQDGRTSIHLVDGDFPQCYDYLQNDPAHLNHRIRIKKSYGLDGNISIYNVHLVPWYGKLQWLRLPILPIGQFEASFGSIIRELEESPDARFEPSELGEYLDSESKAVIAHLKSRLGKISPSSGRVSFETICEHILKSAGYEIVEKHVFDRKGGDVDLRCVRSRSDLSPFEAGEVKLVVQVKKHKGTTDHQAVEQLLKMMEKEEREPDGCVLSLADGFTDKAQKLAENNGIVLMAGDDICKELLRIMFGGEALP